MTTNRSLMAAVLGVGLALATLPGAAGAATMQATRATSSVAAARAAAAPSVAAPAGRLAPSGCDRGSAEVTCDLWAKPGTAQVLGQPLPIWGFAGSAADPATAPGPVLVVQQGDHVTVTLHNGLGQPMSLALPGQPVRAFDSGLDSTEGVAPGGSASYTFTAARPGTFVYEAGHTADGARQVAMGLAGALVVLPADGSAYGSQATAYDDDAVLVLSDVDPDLNAAPMKFDMRDFRARYRLVNGKAFPSTDPVPTAQGNTVLLRYVNVGSLPHPMGLLGADQTQVAQDGHPMTYPTRQLVADLQPGATADTLVHMPTSKASRVTVYEAGGHLDNSGQTQADPTRLAFGGMMTYLDTAAAVDSGDAIGPVPSHVDASPNPSDGLADVTVTADLSDASNGGSDVDRAELVVDDATTVGAGFGAPMQIQGTGAAVSATGTLPVDGDCSVPPVVALSCLAAGKHRIFVRGHDASGNWGVIGVVVLRLPKTGPLTRDGVLDPSPTNGNDGVGISATGDDSGAGGTIDRAEYFIDTLDAPGTGTPLAVNRAGSVVSLDAAVPAAVLQPLAEGVHHVLVRSHDDLGLWGPELDIPLVIDRTGPTVTAAAVMPNPSNGELDDPGNPGNVVVSAQIQDAPSSGDGTIVAAEGFLDPGADPQPGTGFDMLAVDGAFDGSTEAVYGLIPVSEIHALENGDHVVRVRGRDAAGNWGDLFTAPLTVDKTAPTLGTLTATPNPTAGARTVQLAGAVDETAFGAAEVFLGDVDPGPGNATPIQLTVSGGQASVAVPLPPFTAGFVPMNVRVQDLAGNWSNTQTVVVRVTSGTRGAAGALGFATTTGRLAVSKAGAIAKDGDQVGVVASLPGGSRNAPAYVRSTSKAGVDSYRATFSLAAHRLRLAGGAPVTVFQGLTPAGKGVFSIQLRSSGSTTQLRTVLDRTGKAPVTGDWRALSAATHHVSLHWVSGKPTGATEHGTLQVLVDGKPSLDEDANTSGLQLGGVRLGLVDRATRSASGALYLDGFSSAAPLVP